MSNFHLSFKYFLNPKSKIRNPQSKGPDTWNPYYLPCPPPLIIIKKITKTAYKRRKEKLRGHRTGHCYQN